MSDRKKDMLTIAERLGISIDPVDLEMDNLSLNQLEILDLLPEMLVMVRSLVANKTFSFKRNQIGIMDKGLLISFQNIFDHQENGGTHLHRRPHVRITPSHVESSIFFEENIHLQQLTILIEMEYLKSFIGRDIDKLSYLFETDKTFWIEEFMSPEMVDLANQMANLSLENILSHAYYRIKALEMIYMLFSNLLNREHIKHHHLTRAEISAIYLVRNAIGTTLHHPPLKNELVQLSGMNEQKLRKFFTQVFGKGIYEYYNELRMQEAARLLRLNNLSVSEVGYQLGFSNLSYFGRLFEKCFGLKPKKWQTNHSAHSKLTPFKYGVKSTF